MSFAVIQTGGKQYKVKASEILKIERLKNDHSNKIEFKEVLAYGNDKTLELGSPLIQGAKVEAEVLRESRAKKVIIFKKKRRKGYHKKQGHRQTFTEVKVTSISA